MKSIKFLLSIATVALLFTSCQPNVELKTTLVDFENVTLKDSVWNGSDLSGVKTGTDYKSDIQLSSILFSNTFSPSDWGGSWKGFAFSAKKDSKTTGWNNQYSVIAGGGAINSKQFALAFDSATISCPVNADGAYSIKSMMLTNSTYAYWEISLGGFGKKFVANDWFKVIITGYLNNVKTSSVDYYLADFRDGKTFISNTWNKVDVSALGKVDKITFTFDSTDKDPIYGMNTPAYVCIDNIEFTQTISTK